jgi:ribosomal protein L11 methyltransferase
LSDLSEVHFCVPASAAAAVESFLLDTFGHGIEQRDSETLERSDSGRVEFVCWLAPADVEQSVREVQRFLDSLREMGQTVDPFSWHQTTCRSDGWEEAYRQHFQLARIGRRFVIKPTWEDYEPKSQDRLIELEPGMAFGTGLHASTKLALTAMERCERHGWDPPHSVLDLGCGTGVLAIAAARVWHRARPLAIDNDETAVRVCRENVERNGLSPRIRVERQGASTIRGRFDLILANLSYDLLGEIRPTLRNALTSNGRLVLSGLLTAQARGARARLLLGPGPGTRAHGR